MNFRFMRIAIDARMMGPMATRGIGRYTEELVRALISLKTAHTFVLLERDPESSVFNCAPDVEHIKADVPWYRWEEQTRMPGLIESTHADLVHFPHWNVPFNYRGPTVLTIHDLLLRHQPGSAKASLKNPFIAWTKRLGQRIVLRRAIDQARAILVPTHFVERDVHKMYPLTATKVTVTGEGLSRLPTPDFCRVPSNPFILYVGSAYPHKRLDFLVDAWQAIHAYHPDLSLVIAGEEDVFMARHVASVKQKNLPRVIFTGRVTDAELAGLYQRAELFVFPSSFEGFGLPPIEALSYGCPVVSSDSTCLPEVLPKDGVFFFKSGDKDAMIRAIDTAFGQLSLAKQSAQAQRPLIEQTYRWEEVAKKTLGAYERVIHA